MLLGAQAHGIDILSLWMFFFILSLDYFNRELPEKMDIAVIMGK